MSAFRAQSRLGSNSRIPREIDAIGTQNSDPIMIEVLFAFAIWAVLFVGFRKQPWSLGDEARPASTFKAALLATLFTGIVTLVSLAKFHR